MAELLEWAAAGDRYRDYCLWDYAPLGPTEGRLRQSSLLWQSFAALGAPPRLRAMVEALRAELGPFETVWGVKRIGERFVPTIRAAVVASRVASDQSAQTRSQS